MMDNLGAIGGPLLALACSSRSSGSAPRCCCQRHPRPARRRARSSTRSARPAKRPKQERKPIRIPASGRSCKGDLGRLFVGIGAFEIGNVAATLLILRATELLTPGARQRRRRAARALRCTSATTSPRRSRAFPAGTSATAAAPARPPLGAVAFATAYVVFALTGPQIGVLAVWFVLAGVGHRVRGDSRARRRRAPRSLDIRGSAFGVLATVQSARQLRRQRHRRTALHSRLATSSVPVCRRVDGHRRSGLRRVREPCETEGEVLAGITVDRCRAIRHNHVDQVVERRISPTPSPRVKRALSSYASYAPGGLYCSHFGPAAGRLLCVNFRRFAPSGPGEGC